MSRRPVLLAAAIVVALAAVGVGVATGTLGGPRRHDSGGGPLATHVRGRADQMLGLDPVNAGKTYSFVERLCVLEGGPVVVDAVRPTETLGGSGDWTYLGATLRHVPAGDTHAFLSVEGYPPADAAGTFVPIAGAEVDTRCDAEPSSERTELILGFATTATSAGGGWRSTEVSYHQGDRPYVLVIHDSWVLCGPALASAKEC